MENGASELAVIPNQQAAVPTIEPSMLSIKDLKERRGLIMELLREIMEEGVHYGVIPGTQKPSLLKAGAELICSTFRLAPRYQIEREDLGDNHRSYEISTTLYHVGTGAMWGQGVGSCSTMEKKYRYVRGNEHPDIADTYNTCLKMAKKRSLIDAILTATAASDMFFRREEEEGEDEARGQEGTLRTEVQTQGAEQTSPATKYISQEQIKFLMTVCRSFNVEEQRLLAYLAQEYGIESRKQIPVAKYDDIVVWVKRQGGAK